MEKGRKIARKDDALIEKINKRYANDKVVPYMGNPNLPSNRSEFQYDADRMKVIKKCHANILYFAQHFFYIVNLDEGKQKINLHSFQRDALRMFRDNKKSIMCCSRQVGKTTLMTIYALWLVTFFEFQRIVIVANKEKTAQEILERIKLAYEELPNWLKPQVDNSWGKQEVAFTNGSKIQISATSADAIRGKSCNCLIVDEMAFIDTSLMQAFWSAVYPTISSSEKSKCLIASTPNGVGNQFHKLWEGAEQEGSGWGRILVTWHDIPGRDDDWAKAEQIALGEELFTQEYECKFLEAGESVLPEDLYNELQRNCRNPRVTFDDDKYKIFEEPNVGERIYCAGVDIAEGVGQCASTINIMDITELHDIKQVATYHDNEIGPYEFARKINDIMKQWGKPPLAVERNNTGGGVVITQLDKEYNYPNLIQFAVKQGKLDYGHLKGVTSSTNTKSAGVLNLFYWLKTQRRVTLRDINYLKELNTFVRGKNNKWAKKSDDYYDDRVDALIWSLIAIHEVCVGQYFQIVMWDDNKKPMQIFPLYDVYSKNDSRYGYGDETNNFGASSFVMPVDDADMLDPDAQDMSWLYGMRKEGYQDDDRDMVGFSSYTPPSSQFLY